MEIFKGTQPGFNCCLGGVAFSGLGYGPQGSQSQQSIPFIYKGIPGIIPSKIRAGTESQRTPDHTQLFSGSVQ